MQKTPNSVMHKPNKVPSSLYTADEVSRALGSWLSGERILDLAEHAYMPHYRIDGGPPIFSLKEVKAWIAENLVSQCAGEPLPVVGEIVIVREPPAPIHKPPRALRQIEGLRELPMEEIEAGIYFLCTDMDVMYIGQSTSLHGRITEHRYSEAKKGKWVRVFFLPCLASELNHLEGALIRALAPPLNGRNIGGRPCAPGDPRRDADLIAAICTTLDVPAVDLTARGGASIDCRETT